MVILVLNWTFDKMLYSIWFSWPSILRFLELFVREDGRTTLPRRFMRFAAVLVRRCPYQQTLILLGHPETRFPHLHVNTFMWKRNTDMQFGNVQEKGIFMMQPAKALLHNRCLFAISFYSTICFIICYCEGALPYLVTHVNLTRQWRYQQQVS